MLSPISDKSQEQGSSESQSTPKVSPNGDDANANIEAQCDNHESDIMNDNEREKDKDDSDEVIAQALDVPWEVPKLRRRIQRSKGNQNLKAASTTNFEAMASVVADPTEVGLRGSDSGISMTSQQEQEIRELLNVPWDMPKLRKKTEQMLLRSSSSRPNSMPAGSNAFTLSKMSSSNASRAQVMFIPLCNFKIAYWINGIWRVLAMLSCDSGNIVLRFFSPKL